MYLKYVKRILDILISVIALPFLGIIFIIFAPLIFFNDRGPVFYLGKRLGKNGEIFSMYKFRSMKVNSPNLKNDDGSTYNSENDSRVTSIGKFLRKTSLDETPQIINVLKGDMSIIGPRAFLPTRFKGMEYLSEEEKKRLTVLPGITGYCQAYFRNSISHDEKVKWDAYYVDHVSFLLDIKIFIKTISSVITQKNIFTN